MMKVSISAGVISACAFAAWEAPAIFGMSVAAMLGAVFHPPYDPRIVLSVWSTAAIAGLYHYRIGMQEAWAGRSPLMTAFVSAIPLFIGLWLLKFDPQWFGDLWHRGLAVV